MRVIENKQSNGDQNTTQLSFRMTAHTDARTNIRACVHVQISDYRRFNVGRVLVLSKPPAWRSSVPLPSASASAKAAPSTDLMVSPLSWCSSCAPSDSAILAMASTRSAWAKGRRWYCTKKLRGDLWTLQLGFLWGSEWSV